MNASRWTDTMLDAMRQQGDDEADRAVAAVYASGRVDAIVKMLTTLVNTTTAAPALLPPELDQYLDATARLLPAEPAGIAKGQRYFAEHAPSVLMVLATYSLPAAYAAHKGVEVLHRTGFLRKRPNRRLYQTTQMMLDVMAPGGLAAGGQGIRTAQRVRLMHAGIRHLLLHDEQHPWDTAALGVPINQEDLAGTLMTFSWIVIDGLRQLRVRPRPGEEQSYFEAWCAIGRVMGVRDELIPGDLDEARALADLIHRRQIAYSDAGREMTLALIGALKQDAPPVIRRIPEAMMWRLLPDDVPKRQLGVAKYWFTGTLVDGVLVALRAFDDLFEGTRVGRRACRAFFLRLVRWTIQVDLRGQQPTFAIPTSLRDWEDSRPARAGGA